VNRRDFARLSASAAGLAALSGACGVLPLRSPTRVPRIAFLATTTREALADRVEAFLKGLQDVGYVEGETVAIEWRFVPGDYAQLPQVAAELAQRPVDLIVVWSSTPGTLAAMQATQSIPILAAGVALPVEAGLVSSLARPGGNVTALAVAILGSEGKLLELLQEVVPTISRIAGLVELDNPVLVIIWQAFRKQAEAAGIKTEELDLHLAEDLESAFDDPAMSRAQALVNFANNILIPRRPMLAELALQHRLAGISSVPAYAEAGLLLGYGPNVPAIAHRAGVYVDKILRGSKPADLPVEQPTTFDLAVNVSTLNALGLTIPPSVLPLVTEWVQ
jgi:putative ABC transport system substrate-binding protein